MAAPAFRSYTQAYTSGVTSTTPTEPAGAAANDILVAFIYVENANPATITPPSGWSAVFNGVTLKQDLVLSGAVWTLQAFWIRRGGSAPSYASFSWSPSSNVQNLVAAYPCPITTGDPWSFMTGVLRDNASVGTYPSVSGTTLTADELLIWVGCNIVGIGTLTQPTGYTPRHSANGSDLALADKTQATAASVTASGADWSGGNGNAAVILLGLRSISLGVISPEFPETQSNGDLASPWTNPYYPTRLNIQYVDGWASTTTVTTEHWGYRTHSINTVNHDWQISGWFDDTDVSGAGFIEVFFISAGGDGYSLGVGNAFHLYPYAAGVRGAAFTNFDKVAGPYVPVYVEVTFEYATGTWRVYEDGVEAGNWVHTTYQAADKSTFGVAMYSDDSPQESRFRRLTIKDYIEVTGPPSEPFTPIPANLHLVSKTDTQINLAWDAVAGATGYDIERNGIVIATDVSGTTYSDTGLSGSTEYTHRVRSVFT
jgi:hypothetical protein